MELRALYTFIVAAEKMNFSKAAKQLGYTQATVSIHINQLEKELGTPLFDRIGKSVFLTDKGRDFLVNAQNIIHYTEQSIAGTAGTAKHTGLLRIGTSESILSSSFPTIIKEFHALYPDIQLSVKTDVRDSIFHALHHNELDFAYTIDINLIDHNWTGRTVREDQAYFVVSPNNPLANIQPVTIEAILTQDLAMTEMNIGYTHALFQLLAKKDLTLLPYLESGNTDLLKQLVIENKAISYLPLYCVRKEIAKGLLTALRIPEYEVSVFRQIYWHKNKYLTKPMMDFMELIEKTADIT